MQINLVENEIDVLIAYKKHLWKVANISLSLRETLNRVIQECKNELIIAGKDLAMDTILQKRGK